MPAISNDDLDNLKQRLCNPLAQLTVVPADMVVDILVRLDGAERIAAAARELNAAVDPDEFYLSYIGLDEPAAKLHSTLAAVERDALYMRGAVRPASTEGVAPDQVIATTPEVAEHISRLQSERDAAQAQVVAWQNTWRRWVANGSVPGPWEPPVDTEDYRLRQCDCGGTLHTDPCDGYQVCERCGLAH